MRDPKQIDRVLNVARACWKSNAEKRLGQLISEVSFLDALVGRNAYDMEDEELARRLLKLIPANYEWELGCHTRDCVHVASNV